MNYLTELAKLAGTLDSFENPKPADWQKFETANNRTLPADYKLLVSHFGTGHFGTGFYLLNPCAHGNLCLSFDALFAHREAMMPGMDDEFRVPMFPERDGLLCIGECATRQWLYLTSEKHGLGLVHCDYSFRKLVALPMGVTEFVYRLYNDITEQPEVEGLKTAIWRNNTAPFFTPFKSSRPQIKPSTSDIPQKKPTQEELDNYLKFLAEWKDN